MAAHPKIQFIGAAPAVIKSIQYGTTTIAAGATTGTAAITGVTTTLTALLFLGESTTDVNGGQGPGSFQARITLTNATTVTATRNTASASYSVTVSFCVLEFASLKSMQYGTATIAAGATTGTAAIATVVTAKSALFFLGFSNADYSGSWAPSRQLPRITLTNATTVTATRATADGTYGLTAGFCVAEFA